MAFSSRPFVSHFAFATFALGAALAGMAAAADARRHADPGTGLAKIAYAKPAPDFPFEVNGTATSLAAFAGHPVVLNFWATWCAPCADELPVFAKLGPAFRHDVVLIAVSDETGDVTGPYLHAHGVDALSVADPDRKIFDLYGITPLPVTLVLAPDGTVRHVSVGELDWMELQSAVSAVAAPLASPAPEPS